MEAANDKAGNEAWMSILKAYVQLTRKKPYTNENVQ